MIKTIVVSGAKGRELLASLNTTPLGKSFELPPFLPALSDTPVAAFVVEKEDSFWTLACVWEGIQIGDVCAEVSKGSILLEAI